MTRNAIALLILHVFDIFAQVSESCANGRHYKTCKLSLPLFFLVVRTNVGYSIVAEFIIQHEDTTLITEVLCILQTRWEKESINIDNFMIDCQQSEENAICAVFPDSVIYLCAFHQLQAGLSVDSQQQERCQ